MSKYKEILRYHITGLSQREISKVTGISRPTISRVLTAFMGKKLKWEEVRDLSEDEIGSKLFEKAGNSEQIIYEYPDYKLLSEELTRPGVTKKLLWQEYVEECQSKAKIPLQYSQFCDRFMKHLNTEKATMHMNHKPGEVVEVDWAGTTVPIVDPDTGEAVKAYLFVATLPFSQKSYVELTADMKEENWIMAHVGMFEYFGGIPKIIICDNLKTGVVKHPKNGEIIINRSYQELADYYDVAILPAGVRKPKEKASAEGTVGKVTTSILAKHRNEAFHSIYEANQAFRKDLEQFNNSPFQKREGSRNSVFDEYEKPLLRPLPKESYEYGEWKVATVQYNYHISVDKMYYSVPYKYIKEKVDVRITRRFIEIYYDHKRIASHRKLYGHEGQYSTNEEHMPEKHQKYSEWDRDRFVKWANKIGSNTETVVTNLLDSYSLEQQGYNGARAILKLADSYSPQELEVACIKALQLTSIPRYKHIKLMIEHVQDDTITDSNDNEGAIIRGAQYYRRDK